MNKKIITQNGVNIAVIDSSEAIITDVNTALDLIGTVYYSDGCDCMCVNKEAVCEDFFKLSTGIAGEILQKFVNYSMKLAIIGDFSEYNSKPLKDFIYECNNGGHIFFVKDTAQALEKLAV